MHINKPSATKIEAAERVYLLHSSIYRFEEWELYPYPDIRHFMLVTKKTLAFRHTGESESVYNCVF